MEINGMGLPKRKKNRLYGWDYSQNGAYFVTICTKDKVQSLCRIRRGDPCGRPQIEYTPLGEIVLECIPHIETTFGIRIDKHVIMPNHIHMIVFLQNQSDIKPNERATARVAPTLGRIVGGYKSLITVEWLRICKQNETHMGPLFQRSFHDHIIRNERDYQRIWNYIDTNPTKWEEDCFYAP